MSFASRLTRCPIPYEPDRGQDAASLYTDLPPELRELIAGAAGGSPYLAGLLKLEQSWLAQALSGDPDQALEDELVRITSLDDGALSDGLRQAKRRIAALAALADLGGVWPLEVVTSTLTRLADGAIAVGLRSFLRAELLRGKVPGMDEDALENSAGMVVFAMGKMGAHELNYSSDIDLICLFDETRFNLAEAYEARAAFIRVTRKLAKLLSDNTSSGYVFRTDLRLRPDAAVTPVCLGMEAAERYYESLGRTWERAAWIKARACAGDLAGGDAFLKTLSPFVWRRYLDFAAVQDAHDMRLRIRDHKGLSGIELNGHDLKLGPGGIREIEFFTQTRQLIAGGRDLSLRVRETVEGLSRLAAAGWIPEDIRDQLCVDYKAHREVEHRLQMIADQQTHTLPEAHEDWTRLACLMGQADPNVLRKTIQDRLERVAELTEGFFAPEDRDAVAFPKMNDAQTKIVEQWPSYPALRSERAKDSFRRLQPQILQRLHKAARPDEALLSLDGFLAGLPAGVQLFALFEANPQLIDLIVDIAVTSPELARYLSRNASVFDAVIGGAFFEPWPGGKALAAQLDMRLKVLGDYERKLDAARRWMKEWHFRIGVHHLRGLIGAEEAGKQYADLAGAVVQALFPAVVTDFASRHGPPPGRGAVVLGMGSLGAGLLSASSDLDLIVVYDPLDAESSEGRRPLATRPYYARLTQALVTALSAQMADGRLYEVDMRLRPSGRQGPVATSFEGFKAYQENEAWTWEHLALTRARVVAATGKTADDLAVLVEDFRRALLAKTPKREKILEDVQEMRARLFSAKAADSVWDIKRGPGGLTDIELVAETLALLSGSPTTGLSAQLRQAVQANLMDKAEAQILTKTYRFYWSVQAVSRLLSDKAFSPETAGEGGINVMLRETDADTVSSLQTSLEDHRRQTSDLIEKALK